MNLGAWVTVLSLAALFVAVHRGSKVGEWVFKPLAATGFVISALQHGALQSRYGVLIYLGLCLSWWGDVLLIPKTKKTFLAGLGAFLLAHLAYAAAFVARGMSWTAAIAGFVVLTLPLAAVGRWLLPKVPTSMRLPVRAYMAVITAMVACAMGTVVAHGGLAVLIGALAFYLSDLSVARDRFVSPGFDNKLWGWPLYFGAQLVLAATVALR
jgi:uncharacterized membrane protein YhhN